MERETNLIPSESVCKAIEKAAKAQKRANELLSEAIGLAREEASAKGYRGFQARPLEKLLKEKAGTGIGNALCVDRSALRANGIIEERIETERKIATRTIRAA